MKNVLLILTLLLSHILTSQATHLMGGEITWECLPNGQFQFTMKAYRDCNSGIITIDVSNGLQVHNYPTVNSPDFFIPLFQVSQRDISPPCFSCDNPGGMPGAVEEFVFKTAPVTLTGTPPAAGWIFSYDGCCRNAAVTNLVNAGNEGFVLRAKMFAYNGMNANTCYDSSPTFAERPSLVSCTENAVTYSQSAYDSERDSLSYSWSNALDDFFGNWTNSNPAQLTYINGYSPESPLPGIAQNPLNEPAVLNSLNGTITFRSYTQGNFVTVVKVEAWKCGTKVAEVYREIQITLLGCHANVAPVFTPPFQDVGGNYTLFTDTVSAGDLVNFSISATDNDTVILYASGNQFGLNFTAADTGCTFPPCATLSAAADTANQTVSTVFNWQTDCSHVADNNECISPYNTYTFVFHASDYDCPLPAENVAIVSIVVVSDSLEDAPSLRCVSVLPNGDAELNWVPTVSNYGTFNGYHIYHSSDSDIVFTKIDSIADINATTYTHVGANADNEVQYYYIRTRSGCGGEIYGSATETFATILPFNADPTDDVANLEWNALATPLPNTTLSGYYRIYRMLEGGNWILIDSTQSLTYQDDVSVCNDSVFYRVEIEDNSGCISVSAITGGDFLTDVTADFTASAIGPVSYAFVNSSENALFYLWDFGDGGSSQSMNTTHTFADTGSYIVTLIAWNSCDTDTFIMPLTVTGINEAEGISAFDVFPNPASTTLTIQSSATHPQTLRIVNTLGQVVFSSIFDVKHSTFNISNLNTGLYHLLLEDKQGRVAAKKLVVAR